MRPCQQIRVGPGDGRRIVRRPAWMRQPISGSGRPRELVLAAGCAEGGVDLAGDVPLEAADDLFLRQAFLAAPFDVGAGRRVGAHPGEAEALRPATAAQASLLRILDVALWVSHSESAAARWVREKAAMAAP